MLITSMQMMGTRMATPISPFEITRRNKIGIIDFLNSNPTSAQITAKETELAKQDLAVSQTNFVNYILNLQIKANKENAQQALAQNIKNRVCKYV